MTCNTHPSVTHTGVAVLHVRLANYLVSALREIIWRVGQRAKYYFGTHAQENSVGLTVTHTLRMLRR